MTTTGASILQRAQLALQDLTGVRWPATELVLYLNDAQRVLLTVRPDQNAVTQAMTTVAGARQTIPSTAMSLIEVNGNTAGRAMRKVDLGMLDATNRDWVNDTPATVFVNYCYDLKDPRVFWVYPPSAGSGGSVDLIICTYPADMSASGPLYSSTTGNIVVPDQWDTALLNYVLYRAYSKDAEFGGNAEMAQAYMGAFTAMVGAQSAGAGGATPKN